MEGTIPKGQDPTCKHFQISESASHKREVTTIITISRNRKCELLGVKGQAEGGICSRKWVDTSMKMDQTTMTHSVSRLHYMYHHHTLFKIR